MQPVSTSVITLSIITVTLLAAVCLPKAHGIYSPNDYRDHCHVKGACSFYPRCVKPKLNCGVDYALERCHAIHMLRRFKKVKLISRVWAHKTENCLQTKLRASNPKYSLPDPQTCLAWENSVLRMMNDCYEREDLKNELMDLPSESVQSIVDIFRLGGSYYNTTVVDSGLVQAYADGNSTRQELLKSNYTAPTKTRIIMCMLGAKYLEKENFSTPHELSSEEVLDTVNSALHDGNRQDLHYIGANSNICPSPQHHILAWFTDKHPYAINSTGIIYQINSANIYGEVFEKWSYRKQTQCGDGVRQVLEECDVASNYQSCTLDCQVKDGHDCTVELLKPSHCWKEVCGDGHRTRSEDCDDGNRDSGDGCAADCTVETTHYCSSAYNTTTECTPKAG